MQKIGDDDDAYILVECGDASVSDGTSSGGDSNGGRNVTSQSHLWCMKERESSRSW